MQTIIYFHKICHAVSPILCSDVALKSPKTKFKTKLIVCRLDFNYLCKQTIFVKIDNFVVWPSIEVSVLFLWFTILTYFEIPWFTHMILMKIPCILIIISPTPYENSGIVRLRLTWYWTGVRSSNFCQSSRYFVGTTSSCVCRKHSGLDESETMLSDRCAVLKN